MYYCCFLLSIFVPMLQAQTLDLSATITHASGQNGQIVVTIDGVSDVTFPITFEWTGPNGFTFLCVVPSIGGSCPIPDLFPGQYCANISDNGGNDCGEICYNVEGSNCDLGIVGYGPMDYVPLIDPPQSVCSNGQSSQITMIVENPDPCVGSVGSYLYEWSDGQTTIVEISYKEKMQIKSHPLME